MYVKVCGITHLDDALAAIDAGVDVLGFNMVPSSKRHITAEMAYDIVHRVRPHVICVAVMADLPTAECIALGERSGCDRFQLHGNEPPEQVTTLGVRAFKAVRIGDERDAELASRYPGHPLLVDAKVEGQLGGTGRRIEPRLVLALASARPMLLAGGLTPENVEDAVRAIQPWGVDTASGVDADHDVRRKDPDKIRRFVQAARRASIQRHPARF